MILVFCFEMYSTRTTTTWHSKVWRQSRFTVSYLSYARSISRKTSSHKGKRGILLTLKSLQYGAKIYKTFLNLLRLQVQAGQNPLHHCWFTDRDKAAKTNRASYLEFMYSFCCSSLWSYRLSEYWIIFACTKKTNMSTCMLFPCDVGSREGEMEWLMCSNCIRAVTSMPLVLIILSLTFITFTSAPVRSPGGPRGFFGDSQCLFFHAH